MFPVIGGVWSITMEVSDDIAGRIERRLDALSLQPEQVDLSVGLPAGTIDRLLHGIGPVPGGRFLRGLCAALDTDETYLLGLEPGDLVPADLLLEPQGNLGLLSPDEEALLQHYRSLSVPVRAAIALVVAQAAGRAEERTAIDGPHQPVKPPAAKREIRRKTGSASLFD